MACAHAKFLKRGTPYGSPSRIRTQKTWNRPVDRPLPVGVEFEPSRWARRIPMVDRSWRRSCPQLEVPPAVSRPLPQEPRDPLARWSLQYPRITPAIGAGVILHADVRQPSQHAPPCLVPRRPNSTRVAAQAVEPVRLRLERALETPRAPARGRSLSMWAGCSGFDRQAAHASGPLGRLFRRRPKRRSGPGRSGGWRRRGSCCQPRRLAPTGSCRR